MLNIQWSHPDVVRSLLRSCVARLSSDNCIPVMLVLPQLEVIRHGSAIHAIADDVISSYNLPFLNGYVLLQRLQEAVPALQTNDLFRDSSHLKPWLARMIAHMMAGALQKLVPSTGETMAAEPLSYIFQDVVPFSPLAARRVYTNSLMSIEAATIGPEGITIPLGAGEKVVAVAANLAETTCPAEIFGESKHTAPLDRSYYRGDKNSLVFSILPVTGGGARPLDNRLQICAASELSQNRITIAGIIVERSSPQQGKAFFNTPIDLLKEFDNETLRSLCAVHLAGMS
ncbi:MAG: hypothetical protein J0H19_24340 [Rhodospirillales bacterium]|nr:hypothetical protein [Rhodospirillales bacterium]MBN8929735.1 hypothetical protein [Rhodospirillales bacterium]